MTTTVITLGDEVRDRITGFQGIATGRVTYISGCDQYLVSPPVSKKGDFREGHFIDVDRLDIIKAKAVEHIVKTAGADKPAPVK